MKKNLGVNILAGVVDIINAFLVLISWFVVLTAAVGEAAAGGSGHVTGGVGAFFYVVVGIGLVIHIVALVLSKKAGISIVGHILGIIGSACFVISMIFAFPALVLLILAAIFSLRQKNIEPKNNTVSN